MSIRALATAASAALAVLALAGCGGADDTAGGGSSASASSGDGGSSKSISLVAYSTPQVVYDEIIPAFNKTPAGEGVFLYLDTSKIGGLLIELAYNPQYLKRKRSGAPPPKDANKYPFGKIVQYAMVVKDVDRLAEFYDRIGFPVSRIDRDNKGLIRRYRGVEQDFRMHMGWSKLGGASAVDSVDWNALGITQQQFLDAMASLGTQMPDLLGAHGTNYYTVVE